MSERLLRNLADIPSEDTTKEIREWISAPDPAPNYHKALSLRLEKTGKWLLDSEQYDKWKHDPQSFLWLYGIPGSGKTIMCSGVIQDVLESACGKGVAYYFFDFNDMEKQNSENMLRSICRQLWNQCAVIPEAVQELFCNCSGSQPTPLQLVQALEHTIRDAFPNSYIILDAVDECKERETVLGILEKLHSKASPLHILVTSRKERDMELALEFLPSKHWIDLQSSIVNEDIRCYVQHRWKTDRQFNRWQKMPSVQKEVESALMEKANGMFRWVVCQMDELRKCINIKSLRQTIKYLPKTLDETYERILCNIDDHQREDALTILRWLTYSYRPLRDAELAEVIAIHVEGNGWFDESEVLPDPKDVITICGSLVTYVPGYHSDSKWDPVTSSGRCFSASTVDTPRLHLEDSLHSFIKDISDAGASDAEGFAEERSVEHVSNTDSIHFFEPGPDLENSGYFRLAHYSVQEYLVSARIIDGAARFYNIQPQISHTILAQSCLLYLMRLEDFESYDQWKRRKIERYHSSTDLSGVEPLMWRSVVCQKLILADYCAEYWIHHSNESSHNHVEDLFLFAQRFFAAPGAAFLKSLFYADEIESYEKLTPDDALCYCVEGGCIYLVQQLLANGANPNSQSSHYRRETALGIAAYEGYTEIVEALLDAGTDPNFQRGGGTALHLALAGGNADIVRRLLAAGADVNARDKKGETPTHDATRIDDKVFIELLVAAGANVDARNENGETPLYLAVSRRRFRPASIYCIATLLAAGADPNNRIYMDGPTILQVACSFGDEAVSKLLVESGADINAEGGSCSRPIVEAAKRGEDTVVNYLMDLGAEIDTLKVAAAMLRYASARGRVGLVQQLLSAGTDVNARGRLDFVSLRYGSPIRFASHHGNRTVVELLLAAGADVNDGGGYSEALETATEKSHGEIVELLLAKGGKYRTSAG